MLNAEERFPLKSDANLRLFIKSTKQITLIFLS